MQRKKTGRTCINMLRTVVSGGEFQVVITFSFLLCHAVGCGFSSFLYLDLLFYFSSSDLEVMILFQFF